MRELDERMLRLGISRDDLEEEFIRGGGNGGQKINKTSSCVRLRHGPSGVEVRCQDERSLALNRYLARVILCDRVEEAMLRRRQEVRAAAARRRRQNARPSRAAKREQVAGKRRRAEVKAGRRRPCSDD